MWPDIIAWREHEQPSPKSGHIPRATANLSSCSVPCGHLRCLQSVEPKAMQVGEPSQRLKCLLTRANTFTKAYPMWTKTNLFSRIKCGSFHSFKIILNIGVFHLQTLDGHKFSETQTRVPYLLKHQGESRLHSSLCCHLPLDAVFTLSVAVSIQYILGLTSHHVPFTRLFYWIPFKNCSFVFCPIVDV